jgi:radical SAM superfamily enzyme YgiQ (UPF0313 family)
LIGPAFVQAEVQTVVEEIGFGHEELNQTDFVFYDDALFVRPEQHIKPILRQVAARNGELRFHTPNGLLARFVDAELAELMARARFVRPRLSLETIDPERLDTVSRKIDRTRYLKALGHLHRAGYKPGEIITYLMMGLPGQSLEAVHKAVEFVFQAGSTVTVSSFSPIPGTVDHTKAGVQPDSDPLLLSNTVYAPLFDPENAPAYQALRLSVKNRNAALGKSPQEKHRGGGSE